MQQRIRDQLTVAVADGLRDDWFAVCIFWSNLVKSDGDPLSDRQVRKSGAHGRITRDDSVKNRGIALRENHAFAPPGGASGEIGKSRQFSVILRDELLGERGDLGVGEIGEVQIRLLVLHEIEVEWSTVALVTCIRTDHRKPAHKGGSVSCGIETKRSHHRSVSATSALHQEITIPFLRHGECKVDSKFLAADARTAVDHTLDAAICRNRRAVTRSPRIRLRSSGSNRRSF